MASQHKRNLNGMYNAPRCQALSKYGSRCQAPAVRGKSRCHVHGGKGSEGKSYIRQLTEASKAARVRDRQTSAEIKRLDRSIRRLRRAEGDPKIIADLEIARRNLLTLTQQRDADLVVSHAPTPSELEAEQNEAGARAYMNHYRADGDQSPEMVRDRAIGAMLGLAVGEAIGLTVDGWERDSYREIGDMFGGGRFELEPGQWGASTAMALALMESLACRNGLDETDFMERMLEWRDDGVFSCTGTATGIDDTMREALALYERTKNSIAGDRHVDNLTCGSLIRIAPVAIRYRNDRVALRDVAARQSRTTHGGPAQIDACLAFAEVLADAIRGCDRTTVLGARYVPSASSVDSIMGGSWMGRSREEIRSNDNVLNALEAAIWCVYRAECFDEAVLTAANLGHDAARIAALAGQLAGAFSGACCIRPAWLERLAWRYHIADEVDALLARCKPSKRRRG